jgi:hypothetical protein
MKLVSLAADGLVEAVVCVSPARELSAGRLEEEASEFTDEQGSSGGDVLHDNAHQRGPQATV